MTKPELSVGSKVKVTTLPPYLKTADPMPMLRPPHIIAVGEEGIVMGRKPGGYWSVRFAAGAFLLESQYLELVPPLTGDAPDSEADTKESPSHVESEQ